jgi:ABC-type nitrate/sulfonate/bicarbonate transport system substrate-binding protein
MIDSIMKRIEALLESSEQMDEAKRQELQELLDTLKEEMKDLAESHQEEAESIAGFTGVSTQQAVRKSPDPRLVSLSTEGLKTSVEGFEVSHPRLVSAVNSLCTFFANMGI